MKRILSWFRWPGKCVCVILSSWKFIIQKRWASQSFLSAVFTPLFLLSASFCFCRNYMNDSLRTDVFLRFSAETVACACIYLSSRFLQVSPCSVTSFLFILFDHSLNLTRKFPSRYKTSASRKSCPRRHKDKQTEEAHAQDLQANKKSMCSVTVLIGIQLCMGKEHGQPCPCKGLCVVNMTDNGAWKCAQTSQMS